MSDLHPAAQAIINCITLHRAEAGTAIASSDDTEALVVRNGEPALKITRGRAEVFLVPEDFEWAVHALERALSDLEPDR